MLDLPEKQKRPLQIFVAAIARNKERDCDWLHHVILPRTIKTKRWFSIHSVFFTPFFLFRSSLRNLIPRHPYQPFYIPVQPVQRFLIRPSLRRNLHQFRPAAAFAQFFFQYFSYFTHQVTSFSPVISFAFSITLFLYRTTSFIISFLVAFMYFFIYSQSGI